MLLQISIWDVNYDSAAVAAAGTSGTSAGAASDDGSDTDPFDGVAMFAPHHQYISGMRWLGSKGEQLLSCSYDGSVRVLDIATGEGLGIL